MKFNLNRYIPSQEVLKGGLLASLFGLLPTIGLGAEYLFIIVIACLQSAGAVININRGLDTQAFLELIIAAVAVLGISNYTAASNDLGDIDE